MRLLHRLTRHTTPDQYFLVHEVLPSSQVACLPTASSVRPQPDPHARRCRVQNTVDRVLLVGGATRMHRIRRMLTDYFEKEPDTDIDSDEAVMHGAAIVAARLGPVSPTGLGGEVLLLRLWASSSHGGHTA